MSVSPNARSYRRYRSRRRYQPPRTYYVPRTYGSSTSSDSTFFIVLGVAFLLMLLVALAYALAPSPEEEVAPPSDEPSPPPSDDVPETFASLAATSPKRDEAKSCESPLAPLEPQDDASASNRR